MSYGLWRSAQNGACNAVGWGVPETVAVDADGTVVVAMDEVQAEVEVEVEMVQAEADVDVEAEVVEVEAVVVVVMVVVVVVGGGGGRGGGEHGGKVRERTSLFFNCFLWHAVEIIALLDEGTVLVRLPLASGASAHTLTRRCKSRRVDARHDAACCDAIGQEPAHSYKQNMCAL